MLDILTIIGPIYVVILIGFVTTRMGVFTQSEMRVFGKFVVKLALPSLIFNALAQRQIREILNLSYLLVYLAGSLTVLGLGYFWCRRSAALSPVTSTIYVMGMSCSNSGFVGYPILLLMLAPVAGVVLALNLIVENVVMIPLLLTLVERGQGSSGPWHRQVVQALMRLLSNSLIIGLVAGLMVSLMDWKLPQSVARTVTMFALTSGALSLFFIGGTLVGLPMRDMGRRVMPIAFGKLIVHPVAVLLAILALPWLGLPSLDQSLGMAAVLMAAMPTMGIYPILAQAYEKDSFSSAALLVTTITSFFTLSSLMWLLQHVAFKS